MPCSCLSWGTCLIDQDGLEFTFVAQCVGAVEKQGDAAEVAGGGRGAGAVPAGVDRLRQHRVLDEVDHPLRFRDTQETYRTGTPADGGAWA